MKKISNIIFAITVLLLLIISGCEDPSSIGLDVQPPSDLLHAQFCDTLSIEAVSLREDSVRSDKTSLYLLGSLSDPVFGKSNASFVTQVRLPSSNVEFPSESVVDSVVLSFVYKGSYGNDKFINPLTVNVWEIDENIRVDTSYYSNKVVQKKNLIGNGTYYPNIKDSVLINGIKAPAQLRIKLDKNLGKQFIEGAADGKLANNTIFTEFFKGLIVESNPVTTGGTIYYFDLLSASSNLTLYYHTSEKPTSFTFVINESCARFNLFGHDYSLASDELKAQLNNVISSPTDRLFIQTMGGVKVKIKFPTIHQLEKTGKVVINKAELILPADETDITSNIFSLPSKLTLVKLKDDGSYTFMPEQTESTFGGDYDKASNTYKFIISSYIQKLLAEETVDNGIVLMVSGSSTRADRVVLKGLNSASKPKIRIFYTLIN